MRRIYTVNNSIHEIIYFALLCFFSFIRSPLKQAKFQQLHSLLFTTNTHCYFFTYRTQIIQRYIKLFTPALWHYFRQIILVPWHVHFLFKNQRYCKNDYLKNDSIVSLFNALLKRLFTEKR